MSSGAVIGFTLAAALPLAAVVAVALADAPWVARIVDAFDGEPWHASHADEVADAMYDRDEDAIREAQAIEGES